MAKLISTADLLQSSLDFKELDLKQYRQLLKCFLGDEVYTDLIFNNTDNIIKELTSLSYKQINNLNFLDYCLLLFTIRQVSIGDTVSLYAEDIEQKQLKIDLRISKVIEQIIDKKIVDLLIPETIDQCYLEYRLPSIREILILEKEKDIYSFYTFFLKSIKFSKSTINLEDYTFKEREEIIQKIPVKVMTGLTKRTHAIVEYCNKINLLQSLNNKTFDKKLYLTLNSQIIAFVIKLIYNTSLESIYELMFALSKAANFSCSFLDDCSPGEFYFFTKKLEEISARQQESNNLNAEGSLPPIVSEFGLE
jgi:hypothetical protein